jgi:type IV secretory pathway VirB10-like protein
MDVRRRLPGAVLAVVAVALTVVIATRVSAGADPEPRDTSPIVITPSATPKTTPTPKPTKTTERPDDYEQTVPPPRNLDDDHSGKGGGGRGRDHPEDD